MEIVFKNARLQRDCTEDRWMQRTLGNERASVLRRRLGQLHAAQNLEHVRLVHRRCHELQGNDRGLVSLDLDGAHRLLIEPAEDPPPRKPDGGLDWANITAVRIMAVRDTHA